VTEPTNDTVALVSATSRLLDATDRLLIARGEYDTTWNPLQQAIALCDSFCEIHPTMTAATLVAGLDSATAALIARADWENNNS
jgi:hypothetical protein